MQMRSTLPIKREGSIGAEVVTNWLPSIAEFLIINFVRLSYTMDSSVTST